MPECPRQTRICIVTPGQIGSNPRVVKEAEALHAAGFRVKVIATRVLDAVEPRDQSLMARIPFELERLDLRSRARWRLRRLAQLGARTLYDTTGLARLADFGLSAFTLPLRDAAVASPADLYIAHYPAALPVAAAAAARHGGQFAYDAEDFHLGDWPSDPRHEGQRKLIRAIESRYLPAAAHVTAASPLIADRYAREYSIQRPTVVLNVFPRKNAPAAPTPAGSAMPGPSLYWFSQTIGPGRGLECAVEAMAIARSRPHLYLRGMLASGYEAALRELAAGHGLSDRLHFLPPTVPDELEREGALYDLGYVGELAETENRQIALTNKLFSYLLGGLPIVASDIPAHQALQSELGGTLTLFQLANPTSLAHAIDAYLLDWRRLAATREQAWRLGQEQFNWDAESARLVKLFDRGNIFQQRSASVIAAKMPPRSFPASR
jgi:glycosyltransferase involved in cell wall biosynthesis